MLGIILLGLTMTIWILSVTTDTGRGIILWTTHILGTILLIAVMMGTIIVSLTLAVNSIGV